MQNLHERVLTQHVTDPSKRDLQNTPCTKACTHATEKINRCNACSEWLKRVQDECRLVLTNKAKKQGTDEKRPVHNPYKAEILGNCDFQKLPSDFWEFTKLFMSAGYKEKRRASETDISGLLCLLINVKGFESEGFDPNIAEEVSGCIVNVMVIVELFAGEEMPE